jgi:hypothetical protein
MWTLSRSTRLGRGSAATGSIVVSPVLAFGLLPLRRGFEIATALKRRPSGSPGSVSMRGRRRLASMAPCFLFQTRKVAAHIWMGEPLPMRIRATSSVGFQ